MYIIYMHTFTYTYSTVKRDGSWAVKKHLSLGKFAKRIRKFL